MKRLPKFVSGLLIILSVLCGLDILALTYLSGNAIDDKPWRADTSPLPAETVNDLCQAFQLSKDHSLCQSEKTVFADEFFPLIKKALPVNQVTYEEMDEKLGKYQVRKGPTFHVVAEGISYYRVWYDLRGDGVTMIIYYFYEEDGKAFKTLTRLGKDDS